MRAKTTFNGSNRKTISMLYLNEKRRQFGSEENFKVES